MIPQVNITGWRAIPGREGIAPWDAQESERELQIIHPIASSISVGGGGISCRVRFSYRFSGSVAFFLPQSSLL